MKYSESPIEYAASCVLTAREFCGNEREAMMDAIADYKAINQCDFPFGVDERIAVMRIVEDKWREYQLEAGVVV